MGGVDWLYVKKMEHRDGQGGAAQYRGGEALAVQAVVVQAADSAR